MHDLVDQDAALAPKGLAVFLFAAAFEAAQVAAAAAATVAVAAAAATVVLALAAE